MKNNMILAVFVFAIGANVAFARGGKEGGGGDICQDRIEAIRNDISDWIEAGGAAALKLPNGVTLDAYKQRMLKEIALTRADGQHSIVCKKNPKDVVVGTSEKICASSSPSKPKIACYRDGFMKLSEDNQYFMVHHEFAFLSGFEDQDGAQSDYPLSDQITAYLQEENVKKLAVKPGHGGTMTVTPVSSSLNFLSNSFENGYYYPAFTSSTTPGSLGAVVDKLGVIDAANGFSFVDLAADSNPSLGIGSENPGVIYFNIFVPNVNFSNPVAIAVYAQGTQAGTAAQLLPIASYNQSMCGNGDGGNCLGSMARGGTSGNYFYGVNYSAGTTITIGLDVQAICRSFRVGSADVPPICSTRMLNNSASSPTSGTPLLVNFAVFNQADLIGLSSYGGVSPVPATQAGPIQVGLNFVSLAEDPSGNYPKQALPPPMRAALCNLTATTVSNPVDSGIEIDGSQFGISSGFGLPGVGAIIAVANLGTTVNDQAQNYTSGNSIIGYVIPGMRFVLGGFQNSTPTQSYKYKIGFLVRDYAGFVFDDQSGGDAGSCTLPGEYSTSQIRGHSPRR